MGRCRGLPAEELFLDKPNKGEMRRIPEAEAVSRGGSPRRASACARSCASTGPTITVPCSRAGRLRRAPAGRIGGLREARRRRGAVSPRPERRARPATRWRSPTPTTSIEPGLHRQGREGRRLRGRPRRHHRPVDHRAVLSSPATAHARHTHGIIKNIEANAPHGHAPGCKLHSANTMDLAAMRWAAHDRAAPSSARASTATASRPTGHVVRRHLQGLARPALALPDDLQAAGNGAATEFVNHKGFNSLTVGNHDDAAGAWPDSVFRNPASTHGDRELPEIAANGDGVTAVN